jgi:hypothetical protein
MKYVSQKVVTYGHVKHLLWGNKCYGGYGTLKVK